MALRGLSRQHYEMIARTLKAEGKNTCTTAIANKLATELADDNPRFDRARFIKAALGAFGGVNHSRRRSYLSRLGGFADLGDLDFSSPKEAAKSAAKVYVVGGAVYAGAWLVDRTIRTVRGLQTFVGPDGDFFGAAKHVAADFFMWPVKAYRVTKNVIDSSAYGGVNNLPIVGALRLPAPAATVKGLYGGSAVRPFARAYGTRRMSPRR